MIVLGQGDDELVVGFEFLFAGDFVAVEIFVAGIKHVADEVVKLLAVVDAEVVVARFVLMWVRRNCRRPSRLKMGAAASMSGGSA